MADAVDGATAPEVDTEPPSGGPNTATMSPKNYMTYYSNMDDALQQKYTQLYKHFQVQGPNRRTPQELFELAVNTSNIIPKVYLYLTEQEGKPRIEAAHRPFRYATHPLETSRWDGEAFIFLGDLMRGNAIVTRRLPVEAFEITNEQRVPNIAAMDPLLQSMANESDYLPAPEDGAADTRTVVTRNMIQVPQKYISLVLNRGFTPKQLWLELAGAIRNDGKEVELAPLLDWIAVSCTRASSDEDANSPETSMGTKLEIFPPLDLDENLQNTIWDTLVADLTGLSMSSTPVPSGLDATSKVVNVMREENALARAERSTERAERERRDAARKTPSGAHPSFVKKWLKNCDVSREEDLEPIYHRWAIVKQGERRLELQAAVEDRATDPAAAGRYTPIVTKEITDIVFLGNCGSRPSQVNDLTKGLSPFTCGFISGTNQAVQVRIDKYDGAMMGNSQPSVAEVESFSTKEIPLPTSTYDCGAMLKATSLILDTIQGPTNPHAQCFRQFIIDDWPDIEDMLQQCREPGTVGNVLPRILRSVQINMVTYLHSVFMGSAVALPKYHELRDIVRLQEWTKLQQLPLAYMIPREEAPPNSSVAGSLRSKTTEDKPAGGLGKREDISPTAKHQDWMDTYKSSGKTLQDIRKGAVPTTIDKATREQVQLCLSYHLKGYCYSMCNRNETHRKLTTSETKEMEAFVKKECAKEE